MCLAPFNGNPRKSQLYFVESLETLLLFNKNKKKKAMETQLLSENIERDGRHMNVKRITWTCCLVS